jgi:antitoxin component YwqK of YwqJK toxin-antitoxin module
VYYGDTSYTVEYSGVYHIKKEFEDRANDWEIFYDQELKIKMADFILRDDTAYHIQYYENGNKKLESKTLAFGPMWVYQSEWCENGQLIKAYNPNTVVVEIYREYDCSGSLFLESGRSKYGFRGPFKMFHQNGQVAEQGAYESRASPFGDQKVGLWESFTPDGKKFYEAFYADGIVVREEFFDE